MSNPTGENAFAPDTLSYANVDVPIDPGNPWFTIWTRPRDVMRWVLATDPTRNVKGLILGGAVAGALSNAGDDAESLNGLLLQLALAVPIGAAIGYLIYYFVSPWLLTMVGRWLGGTGDRVALRAAVAYALIPSIWASAISIIGIIVIAFVLATGADATALVRMPWLAVLIAMGVIAFALAIWQLIITIACVSVAHRFSMWLSFATLLLVMIIVFAAVLIVVLPFILLGIFGR